MINLALSLAIGVVAFLLAGFGLGGGKLHVWYGLVPGLLVFGVAYLFLARRTYKKFEQVATLAQAAFSERDLQKGISILESARSFARWQFLIEPQIDAQIGSVYYVTKEYAKAEPYLIKGHMKHWIAKAQLAVLYFKRRDYELMQNTFEEACKANKKQPLIWNVYAFCQTERGLKEQALSIMNQAVEHNPDDEKSKHNRSALQNNRRMSMRGWDVNWYQFHLDRPPTPTVQPKPRYKRF